VDVVDEVVDFVDWPTVKPTMPNGQLPVLRLPDGSLLPESIDIAIKIASDPSVAEERKLRVTEADMDLYALSQGIPSRELAMLNPVLNWFPKVDANVRLVDTLSDALEVCRAFEAKMDPEYRFIFGDTPGIGDLGLFHSVSNMVALKPDIFVDFSPKWKAWQENVSNLPGIKEYLEERPAIGTGYVGRPGSFAAEGL
jgi:glutathione S-transferase